MNQKRLIFKSMIVSIIIITACFMISVGFYYTGTYERTQAGVYDLFFRISKKNNQSQKTDPVVIIAIDDYSIIQSENAIGINWPWPRNIYAIMSDFLFAQGAKACVFDIEFTGADFDRVTSSGFQNDYRFFQSIQRNKNIIIPLNIENNFEGINTPAFLDPARYQDLINQLNEEQNKLIRDSYDFMAETNLYRLGFNVSLAERRKISHLLRAIDFLDLFPEIKNAHQFKNIKKYQYFFPPYGLFTVNNQNFGFVDIEAGLDGVVRKYKPLVQYNNHYIPSLALAVYQAVNAQTLPENLQLNQNGEFTLNWYGPGYVETDQQGNIKQSTFQYYNAWYIFLNARLHMLGKEIKLPENAFKDKVVFIGGTTKGLLDQKNTPFTVKGNVFPGVEIIVTAYLNLINQDWIRTIHPGIEFLIYFLIAFLINFWGLRATSLLKYSLAVLLVLIVMLTAQFMLFTHLNRASNLLFFIFLIMSAYLSTVIINYIMIGRNRNMIKNAFNTYVSPEILKNITESSNPLSTTGEKKTATALFIDIAGFTTFSEKNSPEKVVEVLNVYLQRFCEAIVSRGGFINKFLGDGLMALFGVPNEFEDHADKAVQSALECINIAEELLPEYGLKIRVGVNSGKMIFGNMGGRKKLEPTAIGDTVNLASRLEGANKFFCSKLLIGENTYQFLNHAYPVQYLGRFSVKGKDIPIGVYYYLPGNEKEKEYFKKLIEYYEKSNRAEFNKMIQLFNEESNQFGPAVFYQNYLLKHDRDFGQAIKLNEK